MHRGFNLTLSTLDESRYQNYFELGNEIYKSNKKQVNRTLLQFLRPDGALDGSKMKEDWFPMIKADVFISHSHRDESAAVALSGWLKSRFDLDAFVDSCVWGNAEDLLWQLDKHYCFNPSKGNFVYETRNKTTSHVHMMLSTALTQMIDKTECLFFLNTPNSISTSDVVDETESPWIYSELAVTKVLRDNAPSRPILEHFSLRSDELIKGGDVRIKHVVDISHLTDIFQHDLTKWRREHDEDVHPLDKLYELYPPKLIKR